MTSRLSSFIFVHVLVAITACSSKPEPPRSPPILAAAIASSAPARWIAARSPEHTALLEAPAQVIADPHGRAVITPPLRARILAVRIQPGSAVAIGDPLVDVALPEAAAAAAAYLAATDEIAAYEHRAAQLEALRNEGLARTADLAQLELELARLRGAKQIAATSLRAAGLDPRDGSALASSGGRTTLRAPIAGIVTAVTAVPGAIRGADEPVVELAAGGGTRLEARLPRPFPEGASVEFVALGAAPVPATLLSIAPAREADGAILAWLELAVPAPTGVVGRVRGRLPAGAATSIPTSALAHDVHGDFVWRRDRDEPRRAVVRVLATSGGDALVEGLVLGDQVAAVASVIAVNDDTVAGGSAL